MKIFLNRGEEHLHSCIFVKESERLKIYVSRHIIKCADYACRPSKMLNQMTKSRFFVLVLLLVFSSLLATVDGSSSSGKFLGDEALII